MHEYMKESYRSLLARIPQSEILDSLRARVCSALEERGMPLPPSAVVLFDDTSGRVLIVDGPYVWEGEADQVANETGEAVLRSLFEAHKDTHPRTKRLSSIARPDGLLSKVLFWGFNGFVLFYWCAWFVYFLFSPDFREWYVTAKQSSDFGVLGLVAFLLLPAIPIATVMAVAMAKHHTPPEHIAMRSFFLFEVPAFVFVFAFNQALANLPLTNGLRVLGLMLALILLVIWYMQVHRVTVLNARARIAHFSATTFLLVAAVYGSLITIVPGYLAYFEVSVPEVLDELLDNAGELLGNPVLAMTVLVVFSISLVPLVLYVFLARNVLRSYGAYVRSFRAEHAKIASKVLVATPIVFVGLLIVLSGTFSSNRYQEELILLAQDTSGYESAAARAQILAGRKARVDKELERTLYSRRSYLFSASDFKDPYGPGVTSHYLRIVASPFIYDDTDDDIQGTRRTTLLEGYRRAYGHEFGEDPERAIAPLKQVQRIARDVHVLTHGNPFLAEVTVSDSFTTFVSQDQEVVYEFSLPEHAVVTGLKLGPSLEHMGQIAPRGAAQQVYTEEVRFRRDPALLEQTGPRQYRLRVYPIPGASQTAGDVRREKVEGPTQRVQFTYLVMRDEVGIPLPLYEKEYNVLANETEVSVHIDGTQAKLTERNTHVSDPREPAALCGAENSVEVTFVPGSVAHLLVGTAAEGDAMRLPLCAENTTQTLDAFSGKRVAILLDTSYANGEGELERSLDDLRALPDTFYGQNNVQLYLFSDTLSASRELTSAAQVPSAREIVYYGKGNIIQALEGLNTTAYDAVVVVTGKRPWFGDVAVGARDECPWCIRSVERPEQVVEPLPNLTNTAVVFVHPRDTVPSYSATFEARFASACTVTASTDLVLDLEHALWARDNGCNTSLGGGYWRIKAAPSTARIDLMPIAETSAMSGGVGELAPTGWEVSPSSRFTTVDDATYTWEQRALRNMVERSDIATISRAIRARSSGVYEQARMFDVLHVRAKELGIVTPLSSYIALVNAQQESRLDDLSEDMDRYTSEQRFAVTQPTSFTSPVGGGGFGAMRARRQSSSFVPLGTDAGDTGFAPEHISSTGIPKEDVGMLPRVMIFLLVIGVVGGGAYGVLRVVRKKKKKGAAS